jgi:tetratricopeptide (TPR) repeat protein
MHFVSYSRTDGKAFVQDLVRELDNGLPPIRLWIDKQDLRLGQDWDDQLAAAIRECETFLFVMTEDSVAPGSTCKHEWTHALRYKKPIIPLHLDPTAEPPLRLNTRQWLEVSRDDLAQVSAALRRHWNWLSSPGGQLRLLEERLEEAERDLRRAPDTVTRGRIEHDIQDLKTDIDEVKAILGDEQARQRVEDRLGRDAEEQDHAEGVAGAKSEGPMVLNVPPVVPPDSFQDRRWETELLAEYLRNPSVRLVEISGPASIGKTAMVCRLLHRILEGDHGEGWPVRLDGVVYLGARGNPPVSEPVLRETLSKLLPKRTADRLRRLFRDPATTRQQRVRALLAALGTRSVVVLLDALDELVDPDGREDSDGHELRHQELVESLRLFQDPQFDHGVKVVVTSRVPISSLASAGPAAAAFRLLPLDEGLPSPYAEEVLRSLDKDGTVGLRDAPEAQLERARRLTDGNPMALEMIYAILRADRLTTLEELLDAAASLEPDKVLEDFLLREALSRLDDRQRQVIEALAIFQTPVEANAVEHLLRPYGTVAEAATVLRRLSDTEIVRRDGDRYQLPKRYWRPVLDRIPRRPPDDWDWSSTVPPYSQTTLLISAAEYFEGNYTSRFARREVGDLTAQLSEFDLLVRAEEYDRAAWVLLDIDGDYLLPWGHARDVLERHRRLEGHLDDPEYARLSLGRMGSAYLELADYPRAIHYYRMALERSGTPAERKPWVLNLGSALFRQGKTAAAVKLYEEALNLARSTGDRRQEAKPLAGLGLCHRDLGDHDAALRYAQEALEIAQEAGDLRLKADQLAAAGTLLAELGQPARAWPRMEEALALATGRRYRLLQANCLADQAELLLDEGEDAEAANVAELTLKHNQALDKLELTRQGNYLLALGRLRTGDLERAGLAADLAADCHPPRWWHPAAVVQGIVRLHTADREGAADAFSRGVAEAEYALEEDSAPYPAHDAMGLGLLGLAMAQRRRTDVSKAARAFEEARKRTGALGVVRRVGRLLDDLERVDPGGVTGQIRAAATGAPASGRPDPA